MKYGVHLLLIIQVTIIICFLIFMRTEKTRQLNFYDKSMFKMLTRKKTIILVGFGYILTFLKRYTLGSIVLNMLLVAILTQWTYLVQALFYMDVYEVQSSLAAIYEAASGAMAVLVSYGVVLGRLDYSQTAVMGLMEVPVYVINHYFSWRYDILDYGETMSVHVFGAYFGLGVSYILHFAEDVHYEADFTCDTTSDTFALLGTLFIWCYWPCYMMPFTGNNHNIVNSYLALAASVTAAFLTSGFLSNKRFNMLHIQNATLAGGIAISSVDDLIVQPWGAATIGFSAGVVSVIGYVYVAPLLTNWLNAPDIRGVHSVHGLPGIIGGFASVAMALQASPTTFLTGLFDYYPAMMPHEVNDITPYVDGDFVQRSKVINATRGRSSVSQAGYQGLTLGIAIGIGLLGGIIVGFFMVALRICMPPEGPRIKDDVIFVKNV